MVPILIIILLLETHSTVSNWKQNALLNRRKHARKTFLWSNARCVNFIRWLLFSVVVSWVRFSPSKGYFFHIYLFLPKHPMQTLGVSSISISWAPVPLSSSGSLGTMFPFGGLNNVNTPLFTLHSYRRWIKKKMCNIWLDFPAEHHKQLLQQSWKNRFGAKVLWMVFPQPRESVRCAGFSYFMTELSRLRIIQSQISWSLYSFLTSLAFNPLTNKWQEVEKSNPHWPMWLLHYLGMSNLGCPWDV